jgi:plasmid stabilization system protein ParE
LDDRKQILKYWSHRNKSDVYSIKLLNLIDAAIKRIKQFPHIGALTDYKNIRTKIVGDYLIVYREKETTIEILAIWDCRQNPVKFEKILKIE